MQPALSWRLARPRGQLGNLVFWLANVRAYSLGLVLLTTVGFALRLALLDAYPLREDEAIYGYWARSVIADPFFFSVWPDKPPLFIWLLTGTFALVGPSEASARLVSIFAATLTIPVVALGARRLWHSRGAALLAALLVTLSPFAISFAPTAYTDSLLTLLGTGAVVAALGKRGWVAGLLLGAACMTKQQGLLYAPLVVGLLCVPHVTRKHKWAELGYALLGMASVVLPIVWWDSQRWATAPSPWALAQETYAPLAWVAPQDWLARWDAWRAILWYLGGSWTVWTLLLVALGVAAVSGWRRPAHLLLWGWAISFVLLHGVTTVQPWDRYLLPLAPWLALMASGPLARLFSPSLAMWRLPEWGRGLIVILVVFALVEAVPVGVAAARGQMPIGADHGDYAGLTEAVAWVEQRCDGECPAILYHQVLGWHFRFYLYDALQATGDNPPRFDLRWFPSAAYLADNAIKAPYPPKYLIVPEWATPRDLALHLAMAGLALETQLQVDRFTIFEITQRPRPLCEWCKSTLPATRRPLGLPFAPVAP
jgi:4-amino-4-deoxy-L-arabinose transferase-like glycosyltransferase